jgi:hypothetical protein
MGFRTCEFESMDRWDMGSELTELFQQARQAFEDAAFRGRVLGYIWHGCIVVCAVLSVLIYWKLGQIYRVLVSREAASRAAPAVSPAHPSASAVSEEPEPGATEPEGDDDPAARRKRTWGE